MKTNHPQINPDGRVRAAAAIVGLFVGALLSVTLSGCAVPGIRGWSPPLPVGDDVVLTGHRMCSTPATVYFPQGTEAWQARALWRGLEYWNRETGLELFRDGGILTAPQLLVPYAEGHGRETVILVDYVSPGKLTRINDRPWSKLGPGLDGIFRTALAAGDCMDVGYIGVLSLHQISPQVTEAVVTHEAGHGLGLNHGPPNGVMFWNLEVDYDSDEWPDYSPLSIPAASAAELAVVRAMYGGGQ